MALNDNKKNAVASGIREGVITFVALCFIGSILVSMYVPTDPDGSGNPTDDTLIGLSLCAQIIVYIGSIAGGIFQGRHRYKKNNPTQ